MVGSAANQRAARSQAGDSLLQDIDHLRSERLLQFEILLRVVLDAEIRAEALHDDIAVLLSHLVAEPMSSLFEQLVADHVRVARGFELVPFQYDGLLPEPDLEKYDT